MSRGRPGSPGGRDSPAGSPASSRKPPSDGRRCRASQLPISRCRSFWTCALQFGDGRSRAVHRADVPGRPRRKLIGDGRERAATARRSRSAATRRRRRSGLARKEAVCSAIQGLSRRPSVGSNSTAVSGTGGQNMTCVKPDLAQLSHDLAGRFALLSQSGPPPMGQLHRIVARNVESSVVLTDQAGICWAGCARPTARRRMSARAARETPRPTRVRARRRARAATGRRPGWPRIP